MNYYKITVIVLLLSLLLSSLCGCSSDHATLTAQQVKAFGHPGDTPPPSYYTNLQKTRDWVKAHPQFRM
jgi:hypothetical protein